MDGASEVARARDLGLCFSGRAFSGVWLQLCRSRGARVAGLGDLVHVHFLVGLAGIGGAVRVGMDAPGNCGGLECPGRYGGVGPDRRRDRMVRPAFRGTADVGTLLREGTKAGSSRTRRMYVLAVAAETRAACS